ncbi:caspase family protein [bacterium]|nr:caspase family protein [bacterium]
MCFRKILIISLFIFQIVCAGQSIPVHREKVPFDLVVQHGHSELVKKMAIGPNGRITVTASDDGTIKQWDIQTGKMLRTYIVNEKEFSAYDVVIDPKGKYIISPARRESYEYYLKKWDLKTGKLLYPLNPDGIEFQNDIDQISISPDGNFIIIYSISKYLKILDIETCKSLWEIGMDDKTKNVYGFSVDPSGQYIITNLYLHGKKSIQIRELATGKLSHTIESNIEELNNIDIKFDPSGKYFIVSGTIDRYLPENDILSISVWNFQDVKRLYSIDLEFAGNAPVVFHPSQEMMIVPDVKNSEFMVVEIGNGEVKRKWKYEKKLKTLYFDKSGHYLMSNCTTTSNRYMRLWDYTTGDLLIISPIQNYYDPFEEALFDPTGEYILYRGNKSLTVIRLTDLKIIKQIRIIPAWLHHIAARDTSGQFLYSYFTPGHVGEDFLNKWELPSLKMVKSMRSRWFRTDHLPVDPDAETVFTYAELYDSALVYNLESGEIVKKLGGNLREKGSWIGDGLVEVDPLGEFVFCAFEDRIYKWHIDTGELVKTIKLPEKVKIPGYKKPQKRYNNCLAIDPTRKWIILTYSDVIDIYKFKSGKLHKRIFTYFEPVSHSNNCLAIDPNGEFIVTSSGSHNLRSWRLNDGQIMNSKYFKGFSSIKQMAIDSSGQLLIAGHDDGIISIWDANTLEHVNTKFEHTDLIGSILFIQNTNIMITTSDDQTAKMWNLNTWEHVTLIGNQAGWIVYTPDGYFDASPHGGDMVAMVSGLEAFGVDQFAVRNNRPDIILKRMGMGSQELIDHYYAQYKRRIRRLGITEEQLSSDLHVPEAEILESKQDGKFVSVRFALNDDQYPIKRYNIYVNDVPLFGGYGKEVSGRSVQKTESVELTTGTNKIEVSCFNTAGAESFRAITYAEHQEEVQPDLYFLAFGVSQYQNSDLNLSYAHKDALDLADAFQGLSGQFGTVNVKTYTDDQVTVQNIQNAKDFLKGAKTDDIFVLFIAGHGMYSQGDDATYYYLTHNTDIANLSQTAADFDLIEGLLQGIKSRKKLFLMDTCESGEIDEEKQSTYYALADSRGIKARTSRAVVFKERTEQHKRSYLYQKDRYIYNDLIRRSGAIVFSSSRGGEFSYESDAVQNGLFTEEILKCLTEGVGDSDGNGIVSTDELRDHVSRAVAESTEDAQHPTVDRDNIYQKFGFPVSKEK